MNVNNNIRRKIISELKTAGVSSAEVDARILLEFVTKKSREFLLANPNYELSEKEYKSIQKLTDRRKFVYPIAYIVGKKEFFGLDFFVNPDVLIPRLETELLVEQALEFIKYRSSGIENFSTSSKKKLKILDVGTGSGNIIISLARHCEPSAKSGGAAIYQKDCVVVPPRNEITFFASDISDKTLSVAKKNAKKHGVEKSIKFIKSDLFERIDGKFDLILANLPYVPIAKNNRFVPVEQNQLFKKEIDFEPRQAIFAGDNGAEIIKRFLADAKNYLNANGGILIEVDPRNTKSLATYAARLFENVETMKDYSNKNRFIRIIN